MAIEKIVVVDDEMMIRKALETQLRNKRYSVASASDCVVSMVLSSFCAVAALKKPHSSKMAKRLLNVNCVISIPCYLLVSFYAA